MAKLSKVRSDPKLEVGGVWVDFEAGIRLKIARLNNPEHEKVLAELRAPRLRQIREKTITDQEAEDLGKEAVARSVLLDWENVEDDDGKPLLYTPEVGAKYLKDPTYRDLWRFVIATAVDAQLYRAQVKEETAKNSRAA